jgi:hypothetical protein
MIVLAAIAFFIFKVNKKDSTESEKPTEPLSLQEQPKETLPELPKEQDKTPVPLPLLLSFRRKQKSLIINILVIKDFFNLNQLSCNYFMLYVVICISWS